MRELVIRGCDQRTQPYKPPQDCDVWGINNAHAAHKFKPDLILALDDLQRDYDSGNHYDYVFQIVEAKCPVYSARRHDQWPSVEPYPLKEVLDKLNMNRNAWYLFDNTVCYAVALAIARGYTTVSLYGCEFVQPYDDIELDVANYRWKKKGYDCPSWFAYHSKDIVWRRTPMEPGYESLHWWLGYGAAKGVLFHTPQNSAILNRDRASHFYGYQTQPDFDD